MEIAAGGNTSSFDLTGDGLVDRADLAKWLDDAPDVNGIAIERYLFGDANLDRFVDASDFNDWNANKFTAQGPMEQRRFQCGWLRRRQRL